MQPKPDDSFIEAYRTCDSSLRASYHRRIEAVRFDIVNYSRSAVHLHTMHQVQVVAAVAFTNKNNPFT
jgi:hypothetical protein